MTLEEIVAERYNGFIEPEEVTRGIAKKYQCSLEQASLIVDDALNSAFIGQTVPSLGNGLKLPTLYERGEFGPRLSLERMFPDLHLLMSNKYTKRSSPTKPYLPPGCLFYFDEINAALSHVGFPIDPPSPPADEPKPTDERAAQPSEYEAEIEARMAAMEKGLAEARAEVKRLSELVPPHPVNLMEIAIEVQHRYWSDYDPETRATRPKQELVVAELQEKHGLSKATAQAVEMVACPVSRKKTPRK